MRLLYKTGPMESLRKWFYKPKRDDRSLLAQFFFADDALNMIAAELDSFDGRKDPDRCATLVNQLRQAQDRVLNITSQIMDQLLGDERVARGFRVKFPEDVLADNLAGQLWFGAECLAAGSSIMNREEESAAMRPLAKALTRSLETVRFLLRERCLRPRGLALSQQITADDMLHESLKIFDRLFAEFELCYVSAMVNVKTPHEFEAQQLICVLFSESLRRALHQRLLTQEQVDSYDPALMFAVPRLAIVSGLLISSNGPLSIDKPPEEMSDMFRPFRTLLHKIRSLLWTLDKRELIALERLLATNGDVNNFASIELPSESEVIDDLAGPYPNIGEFVSRFYSDHANSGELVTQTSSSSELTITEGDYLPDNIQVMTPIFDGFRRLSEVTEESEPENDGNITESDKSTGKPDKITDKPDLAKSDRFSDNSTETFLDRSRNPSKTEGSDFSSLRNLSSNGLMMFDPLVINAVSASTSSDGNRQLPDHDLVTSLNEQVTEIADRLSSIASDVVIDQKHSYSISEPALVSADDSEPFPFSNEQLPCMPSTSHGYLIPNAISHEPVVMSSLSHNNSAVFNQEDESNESNNTLLNTELPMIIPENIDSEIGNTNINLSIANANLSSLLLTNEEYRESFVEQNVVDDNTSFHSAKNFDEVTVKDDRVKFMLGYESEHETPADSGVSTENTSLDRSPATENKEMRNNHLKPQNGVITNPADNTKDEKSTAAIKNSIDNVNINYSEGTSQENQAGSSNLVQNTQQSEKKGQNKPTSAEKRASEEAIAIFRHWGMPLPANTEIVTIEHVIDEVRKHRQRRLAAAENDAQSSSGGRPAKKKKLRKKSPSLILFEKRLIKHGLNQPSCYNNYQRTENLYNNYNEYEEVDDDDDDDEKTALDVQAQETTARKKARGKFKSSEDLIHRLFVCIAGVADQLQTNFAPDLRNILKSVFLMNQTPDDPSPELVEKKLPVIEYEATEDQVIQNGSSFDSVYSAEEVYADSNSDSAPSESGSRLARRNTVNSSTLSEQAAATDSPSAVRRKSLDTAVNLQASVSAGDLTIDREENSTAVERAPEWVPDISAPACMRCTSHFTAFRRRHHCRNCGKVFCATCSSNCIPLPRYGQMKPVRVCEECFRSIATNCRRASQR